MPATSQSKAARQEAAREKARQQRHATEKRARRRRLILQIGVVVVVIGIVAVTTIGIIASQRSATGSSADGPANMISDSIVIGTGLVAQRTVANGTSQSPSPQPAASGENRLVIYVDQQCPGCRNFEATNASNIEKWVSAGTFTLEIHPLSFLDRSSLNKYSSRAANAAACVANYAPDKYFEFNTAMFANQPDEGTAGPTNKEIASLVDQVTGTNADITSCITGGTYSNWVTAATARGMTQTGLNYWGQTVTGTPTAYYNGTLVDSNAMTDATVLEKLVAASAAG